MNLTTTDIGIITHQKSAQKCYLLDIIASVSIDISNGISKATATKQSSNWDMWFDQFMG